jgi:hypothetical protein
LRKPLFVKLAVTLVALVAFGYLFMTSLRDVTTAAYTAEREHLQRWTLVLEPATRSNDPLLALRPAPELASGLFRQVFARSMESLNGPVDPAVAVVLRGELDRIVGDRPTPEELLAAAKTAGLETPGLMPRCLVHRRSSQVADIRQVFFVLFDAPAVSRFRQQLGLDPAALSPVLFIAGAGTDFNSWLPQRVDGDADCLAPVEVSDRPQ